MGLHLNGRWGCKRHHESPFQGEGCYRGHHGSFKVGGCKGKQGSLDKGGGV